MQSVAKRLGMRLSCWIGLLLTGIKKFGLDRGVAGFAAAVLSWEKAHRNRRVTQDPSCQPGQFNFSIRGLHR